ncbi:MAG: AbrB/MazE/SpoVT family DNA-binding domain-containing protein, partial [Rubrivivax sp.]|nr:AbrB/MazE/SpoVT family DNA-binding domain-containing protein [Rubrivivax sp.]
MDAMTTLTLSPKFQVVIPKHIREAMQLTAG